MSTRATQALDRANIPYTLHTFHHDPREQRFGEEAADALGVDAERVLKTLVVDADTGMMLAIVPVSRQLSLKSLARVIGAKRAVIADQAVAERKTGYVVGGISPFGVRTPLPIVVDSSVMEHDTVWVSGGRRGVDLELRPQVLVEALGASCAAISR